MDKEEVRKAIKAGIRTARYLRRRGGCKVLDISLHQRDTL